LNHKGTEAERNTKDVMYQSLPQQQELIAKEVVNIAFNIHKTLGPGLLESVYDKCFCYELFNKSIQYERQKSVPIIYNSLVIDDGLRLDLLIENFMIIELKAQEN
jgi:GxxExxY protein